MRPDEYQAARTVAVAAFDDPVIGALLDDLRESRSWIPELSFVAEREGELIGHIMFTRGWVDAPKRLLEVLILSPVSVLPSHQKTGVGTELISWALQTLADRPEPVVFLEGVPRYYPRFGFESASSLGFDPPSHRIPDAAFMVYRLPRYEPWMSGRLVYPDPFWRHDAVGLRDS